MVLNRFLRIWGKARWPISALAALVLWTMVAFAGMNADPAKAPKFVPFGVDFSPYINGQNPLPGTLTISPSQVFNRLKGIRGYSEWVRNYSVTHGMETTGGLAHQLGFKVALGAWLGPEESSAGVASNRQEIANLIAAAKRGEADILVVGSEVLQSGSLPASTLVSYIEQVRSSLPAGIPVTTDDTYNMLLHSPNVVAACDIVMANFYPYWEGTRIDGAISSLDSEYRELLRAAGSKEVWIGETGWPSGGDAVNLAVPNPRNAAYYFLAFNSWAQANKVNSFYFEAYDEAWKAQSEGPQGAHWGIRTSTGSLKEGMNLVYEGYTLPSAIYMRTPQPSTLPGPPSVEITTIPAYGSQNGIAGIVCGVETDKYVVATYIDVNGGWWTKPYFATPTVPINANGTFACDTVTGGEDADATGYEVFVIPSNYTPPAAAGYPAIPSAIFSNSVAYTEVQRPVGYPGSTSRPPVASISSLSIGRCFSTAANAADTVTVTGTIPVADTKATGANVTVKIGSICWQFAPVGKNGVAGVSGGSWGNSVGNISITAGKNKWTFSASMKCAPGNTNWDVYGLLDTTIIAPGIPAFIPVTITVNDQGYLAITSGYYTAQSGKSGTMSGASLEGLGAVYNLSDR